MGTNSFLILSENLLLGSVRKTRAKQNYLNVRQSKNTNLMHIFNYVQCYIFFSGDSLLLSERKYKFDKRSKSIFTQNFYPHNDLGTHIRRIHKNQNRVTLILTFFCYILMHTIEVFILNKRQSFFFSFELFNSHPPQIFDITGLSNAKLSHCV